MHHAPFDLMCESGQLPLEICGSPAIESQRQMNAILLSEDKAVDVSITTKHARGTPDGSGASAIALNVVTARWQRNVQ